MAEHVYAAEHLLEVLSSIQDVTMTLIMTKNVGRHPFDGFAHGIRGAIHQ